MQPTIDVQHLRIGMFVHLDLGWMEHPFAVGSFRIQNAEQIATIRALGLKRLRWNPDKSEGGDWPPPAEAEAPAAALLQRARAAAAAPPAAPAAAPASQQEPQRRCEQHYQHALQMLQQSQQLLPHQPQAARQATEQLSRQLVDQMLAEDELCIRVLNLAAGGRANAHAMNVAVIALLMGRTLGLGAAEMAELGVGALLHDLGKNEVPSAYRHAQDSFNEDEWAHYHSHVALGVAAGRRMGLSEGALAVLAQHHQASDGSGFPPRPKAAAPSLAARVVGLVDHYDTLCNPAVLTQALTPHEALQRLFAQHRQRYDIALLNVFIRMMGVYPAGSVVQLTDDRFAMVLSVNAARPLKPRVLVHDAAGGREGGLALNLMEHGDLGIRRSLKPAQLPSAALDCLAPRPRVAYFFEPLAAPVPHGAQPVGA